MEVSRDGAAQMLVETQAASPVPLLPGPEAATWRFPELVIYHLDLHTVYWGSPRWSQPIGGSSKFRASAISCQAGYDLLVLREQGNEARDSQA